MNERLHQQIWDPESYHNNSKVQYAAALNLIKNQTFKGYESILDLGCGDGKITYDLATLVPKGKVLGIDISEKMIEFANQKFAYSLNRNLNFLCQDANKISYESEFDIVVSVFAIQWIEDKYQLFAKLYRALKDSGQLLITVPSSISSVLSESITLLMKNDKYATYFRQFQETWSLLFAKDYSEIIKKSNFSRFEAKNILQTFVFKNLPLFKSYVNSWLPHLHYLPKSLQNEFLDDLIELYVKSNSLNDQGSLTFEFSRVDIIAKK